jgi:predicted ester cyclase
LGAPVPERAARLRDGIIDLIAEGEKAVAHLKCSATHLGDWVGVRATGRRLENVDEIYIFHVHNGKIVSAFGVEDNLTRLRQLGISPRAE